MATSDHPLVLDLGRVTGKSVFEEWKLVEGNENKTFDDFIHELADLGFDINVANVVEEDNENAVSSGGVWSKLAELGLLDKPPKKVPGTAAEDVLQYSLGSDPAPDEIDAAAGVEGVWTLSPSEGQEWHIDNAGAAERSLTVVLPDGASIGSRVSVFFRPDNSIAECADVTISAGGVLVGGETPPQTIGGVVIEATMSAFGWIVVRHYIAGETEVVIVTKTYRIVYSGANRASTASTSYSSVISWSGAEGEIPDTKSTALRTDIFRNLYGVAPFVGWTTSPSGTSVSYNDGATVSRGDGQTLTLYPLYASTDKGVNLGQTTDGTIQTAAGASSKTDSVGPYTFNPASYVSGFNGEPYSIKIYCQIYSGNDHRSYVQAKVDNGSWVTVCDRTTAKSSDSGTTVCPLSGTGSHTVYFRVFQEAGTKICTSKYQCYVSAMTIK